jgi:hypothetical protein
VGGASEVGGSLVELTGTKSGKFQVILGSYHIVNSMYSSIQNGLSFVVSSIKFHLKYVEYSYKFCKFYCAFPSQNLVSLSGVRSFQGLILYEHILEGCDNPIVTHNHPPVPCILYVTLWAM